MRKVAALAVLVIALAACGPSPSPGPDSGGWSAAHWDPTLTCIRQHESGGDGYGANNGNHYGAYQFTATLWHQTALDAGYPFPAMYVPLWAGANGEFYVQPWIQDEVALWTVAHYGLNSGTWAECY